MPRLRLRARLRLARYHARQGVRTLPAHARHWRTRARLLAHQADPLALELFLGTLALCWGVWVAWPGWDTFTTSPTFRILAALAPEPVWGLGLAGGGALQLAAVARDHWPGRRRNAQILTVVWGFVAWSFIWSSWATTGSVTYALYALAQGWIYWRLGGSRGNAWTKTRPG